MKTNVNLVSNSATVFACLPDGKVDRCNVDNYPAENPAYIKRDGFRMNDVSLLDRLSYDLNVDNDMVSIVASRVKEMKLDSRQDLSERDMIRMLRPSYVQTASEIKRWEEQVYQDFSSTMTQQEVDSLSSEVNNTSDVVEANVESKEVS